MIGRTNAKGLAGATGDYIRPSDWLEIDSLVTAGEQKTVGLYAIYPNTNTLGMTNTVAFTVTGNHTIDWGDGSALENVSSNTQAQHIYDYDAINNSTYCTRGYRQVRVTITPQSGQNITNLQFGKKHSAVVFGIISSQWLDINISGTHLTTFRFSEISHANILEKVKVFQSTTALTSCLNMFSYCAVLKKIELNGLNAYGITSMSGMFSYSGIEFIDLSAWTINAACAGISVQYNSSLRVLRYPTMKVSTASFLHTGVPNLLILDVSRVNFAECTAITAFFIFDKLQIIDLSHTNVSAIALQTGFNALMQGALSLIKCRLPGAKWSFSVANNPMSATELNLLFGDLFDLTSLTAQTITITGCTGAATCDRTIATSKNWTVVG